MIGTSKPESTPGHTPTREQIEWAREAAGMLYARVTPWLVTDIARRLAEREARPAPDGAREAAMNRLLVRHKELCALLDSVTAPGNCSPGAAEIWQRDLRGNEAAINELARHCPVPSGDRDAVEDLNEALPNLVEREIIENVKSDLRGAQKMMASDSIVLVRVIERLTLTIRALASKQHVVSGMTPEEAGHVN